MIVKVQVGRAGPVLQGVFEQISLRKEHTWKQRILKVTPNYPCHRPLAVFMNPQGNWTPVKLTALM